MTRSTTRPIRRLLGAGAALLIVGGALAGCSAHPGQAASMSYAGLDGSQNTVVVTEQEVEDATADLTEYATKLGGQGPSSAEVLNGLVGGPVLEELATEYGITVTSEDARATLEEQAGPGIDYSPAAVEFFRYTLLSTQLNDLAAQDDEVVVQYQNLQSTMSLDISPRYQGGGSWLLQEDPVLQLG
ncbi:hypothetical protein [Actinomyces sp. MRS3W]|uniref:hypothetical protein n=1 Tax=Actinomyces sp. MRS3W TaxID=2800796 RepID=UPI0028FD5EF3|nr:hypothetical protein [Actinomyces sp. MRS3W]MDU0349818.1 hypothetical protein [Actinomyces sp. MRS3W]